MFRSIFPRALALVLALAGSSHLLAQDSNDPYGINRSLNLRPNASTSATSTSTTSNTPALAPQMQLQQRLPSATVSEQPAVLQQVPPQVIDYRGNLSSDVFGANLFTGAFSRQGATTFNPDPDTEPVLDTTFNPELDTRR